MSAGTPLLVAHRVEDSARAAQAVAAGADLIEIDVHLRRGGLEVRHPRRAGPVLWDREGVRLARGPAAALEPLLASIDPAAEPLLDLKWGSSGLAGAALAAARRAGRERLTISSRRWRLLDGLAGEPGVRLAYSAAGSRELGRLRRRHLPDGAAVCVRRDLLDAAAAGELVREHGLVLTWPVRDHGDAERLVAWGVGGLICDDLALLAALRGGPER